MDAGGFGNLISKVLNGGSNTAPSVTAATNQLSSSYDANGNMLSGLGATLAYDGANRLKSVTPTSGGTEYYGYAPNNQRVSRINGSGSGELWTMYGAYGEKLGTLTWYLNCPDDYNGDCGYLPSMVTTSVWFAGKMLWSGVGTSSSVPVFGDRLGTNRSNGARFYPYGEEITSTANDHEKFGTYTRDSFSGLDYAQARYYASAYGRFTSADPSMDGVDSSNPVSWNTYAYVNGDPIDWNDPSGLDPISTPPVTNGPPDCGTDFINVAQSIGLTEQQFFNSDQGILGVMSYFEQSGSGSSADQQVWAALDWTMFNLYQLSPTQAAQFYGSSANVPTSFASTVTTSSQVFSGGQLTSGFSSSLNSILGGAYTTPQCEGLVSAFNVAAGVISSAEQVTVPGVTPIPNPVPGALQFASNGFVPGHGSSFTQGVVSTLRDGKNLWTFYSETYNPPPVRRPPPRRPISPPRRGPRPQ